MKKLFLMGRSEAGKTSLTQILSGEELHYHKTQYTNTGTDIIDSPGEYSETKRCGLGLACFSFEADVLALQDPNYIPDSGSGVYIIFLIIGIIGYFTIPTVAEWVIQSGGAGGAMGGINKAGAFATGVAGGIAGNMIGRTFGRRGGGGSSSGNGGGGPASGSAPNGRNLATQGNNNHS